MESDLKIRVTADLPLGSIQILKDLAESQNISLTEAIRRAIATTGLIQKYLNQGDNCFIVSSCGCYSQIKFN